MTVVPKLAALLSIAVVATPLSAQTSHEGAGATQDMDCGGGTATIRGASNTMTITGRCSALVIEGAGNRVRIDLAAKGTIRISGASNTVTYRTPDHSKARVNIAGAGNRVSMAH